jgi:uncharacterized protein DUF3368
MAAGDTTVGSTPWCATLSRRPPPWLELKAPTTTGERIAGLHSGEAAAIALAEELRADRILIDEQQARKAAAERRLRVTGTIGVLEAAAERELIDLGQAFDRLKQTDFWVTPKFLAERLTRFRERQLAREQEPRLAVRSGALDPTASSASAIRVGQGHEPGGRPRSLASKRPPCRGRFNDRQRGLSTAIAPPARPHRLHAIS